MKKSQSFFPCLLFAALLMLCACFAHAQVSVAIAPQPFLRFTNATGSPLAGGFLYTYQAGTTTLQNTYVDSLGVIQNPDPIPLDATGAPSNSSVQTMIWLANSAYKFCLYDSNLVPQGCKDNLTGYLGLLNLANTWTFQQTFTQPIIDTQTDNQIILGAPGNQTTLDFPPPAGNATLHFPNLSDTVMGRQTTDTELNKSFIQPIVNTVPIVNTPGTYVVIPNATPTGTVLNALTILGGTSASNATVATTSTTSGVQGICVQNCGNTLSATIQQSGQATCIFDGATTFNDAIVPSITVGGDCHDAGAPTAAGAIGTVLSTNGGAGTYAILLTPATSNARTLCADGSITTVNANVTTQQVLKTCQIPAGALNVIGKSFRLTTGTTISPSGAGPPTSFMYFGFGPSSALGTYTEVARQTTSNSFWADNFQWSCVTVTTGASGALSCTQLPSVIITGGGTASATYAGSDTTQTPVNLTVPLYVGIACSFSAGSVSNICIESVETVEQLN